MRQWVQREYSVDDWWVIDRVPRRLRTAGYFADARPVECVRFHEGTSSSDDYVFVPDVTTARRAMQAWVYGGTYT